ncbi:protein unc-13 homolog 4B-like [Macrosteles quadrilineatus]|uniref:protein unc-13 homolog 4B-like n=1 Tax=Macrosteles quadrilineatus TaxID=74068 RepID=UPI0023E1A577|nr:protein unc-13 homolog 4B-like [Macrosteles quadrilineatus]
MTEQARPRIRSVGFHEKEEDWVIVKTPESPFVELFWEVNNAIVDRAEDAIFAIPAKIPEEPKNDHVNELEKKESGDGEKKDLLDGINRDDLYYEILCEIVHTVGRRKCPNEHEEFMEYLQDTFKIDKDKHKLLLKQARSSKPPRIELDVQILEAQKLTPKDSNGLSDPFCSIYLSSNRKDVRQTSVKPKTLSPIWEEDFSLKVDNACEDYLTIEVWDMDAVESVKGVLTTVKDIKGVSGFRKFIDEFNTAALSNGDTVEYIGKSVINLRDIPVTGQTLWVDLEAKGKTNSQGMLKLKTVLRTDKSPQVAAKEYKHLLEVFALHEVESLQEDEEWSGQLSAAPSSFLRQHMVQNSMTVKDVALSKWIAYAAISRVHPVSRAALDNVLQKLVEPISNGLLTEEEIESFWNATKKILPICLKTIRSFWPSTDLEESKYDLLKNTLRFLSTVDLIVPHIPQYVRLFPGDNVESVSTNHSIVHFVEKSIAHRALQWYDEISDLQNLGNSKTSNLIRVTETQRACKEILEKKIPILAEIYETTLKISYAKVVFESLDSVIKESTEPLVNQMCSVIKGRKGESQTHTKNEAALDIGKNLFTLYKSVQGLVKVGATTMTPSEFESLSLATCHSWFYPVIPLWLDRIKYSTKSREEQALEQTGSSKTIESSYTEDSVDEYLQKIKTFWHELSWPNPEESMKMLDTIMNEVYKCIDHCSDMIIYEVKRILKSSEGEAQMSNVTKEWVRAIKRINSLIGKVEIFASNELKLDDTMRKIAESKGQSEASQQTHILKQTLSEMIDVFIEKQSYIVYILVEKMTPSLKHMLMESTEATNNKGIDNLLAHLDDIFKNLQSLLGSKDNDKLSSQVFQIYVLEIYQNLLKLIEKETKLGIEKRKSTAYFSNMRQINEKLENFFGRFEMLSDHNLFAVIQRRLNILGSSTPDLILQVHKIRMAEQNDSKDQTLGVLNVKLRFVENTLRIEVLNAKNLKAMDTNGSSDPYVRIKFLPADMFRNLEKPKTKVVSKNLSPVFNDTFEIKLTSDQRQCKEAMLLFMVKDRDMFGASSDFLGEAYVSFSDIPESKVEVQETQLSLSVPSDITLGCEEMKTLSDRKDDKLASPFVKYQKSKRSHGFVPT